MKEYNEKYKQLFKEDKVIKSFDELFNNSYTISSLYLVGGAVLDIINKKTPKDYDFVGWTQDVLKKLLDNGYKFCHETKSAVTIKKGETIIQLINTDLKDFDFKISQSRYSVKDSYITIDKISFENKSLIPVVFEDKRNAMNALRRIPHWKNKGYTINDLTYLSLLNILSKGNRNLNS